MTEHCNLCEKDFDTKIAFQNHKWNCLKNFVENEPNNYIDVGVTSEAYFPPDVWAELMKKRDQKILEAVKRK